MFDIHVPDFPFFLFLDLKQEFPEPCSLQFLAQGADILHEGLWQNNLMYLKKKLLAVSNICKILLQRHNNHHHHHHYHQTMDELGAYCH